MAAIKGKVVDANTGEPVYNAHVVFSDAEGNYYNPPMGAVTDYDGNYELPTLGGEYLTVSHVSYKKVVKKIDLSNYGSGGTYQTTMNFALDGSGFNLTEVIITPETKQWFKKNQLYVYAGAAALLLGYVVVNNNKKTKQNAKK